MKKIAILALIALAVTAAVSAQSYTVQSVTGRVQMESGDNRVDVVEGNILTAETILHIGLGAQLVLREGERTITVPAAQNGISVADLVAASSRIRITGNVSTVNTDAVNRNTGQVSTASARADPADGDGNQMEE